MLTLIAKPQAQPVAIDEAKAFARIEGHDEDAVIATMIETATSYLDGEKGLLGRALVTQEWELALDGFTAVIVLPLPPLREVVAITYVDEAGVSRVLPTADYRVFGVGAAALAEITPAVGKTWPAVARGRGVVTIRFKAGYGAAADVPAPIRTAILQHVAALYEARESTSYGTGHFERVPFAGLDLIESYRLWVCG